MLSVKHKIIKADVLGFCSGVKLAMNTAIRMREENPTIDIFTFGELIHNGDAIKFLESKNIFALKKEKALLPLPKYKDAIIVVCAHGIEVKDMKVLKENFFKVMDATCPHVLQSQKKAQSFVNKNYKVILVGEKNHQEVLSIKSCIDGIKGSNCVFIENQTHAQNLNIEKSDLPICLIGQTTLKKTEYESIAKIIEKKIQALFPKNSKENISEYLQVLNTICPATQKRQQALTNLAKNCDAILVVGGKNSTNTNRLFQTASKLQPNSFLIENETEVPESILQFERIGISAGASTPDFVLKSVEEKLKS